MQIVRSYADAEAANVQNQFWKDQEMILARGITVCLRAAEELHSLFLIILSVTTPPLQKNFTRHREAIPLQVIFHHEVNGASVCV